MDDAIDDVLARLSQSRFRGRFRLKDADRRYAAAHGMLALRDHARRFIAERLAPAAPPNDGKQTPMRGHPVFLAQHATATCCRSCLAKWHGLPRGRPLTDDQAAYVVAVIERWIVRQAPDLTDAGDDPQAALWPSG